VKSHVGSLPRGKPFQSARHSTELSPGGLKVWFPYE
jgi:hypothetical protein